MLIGLCCHVASCMQLTSLHLLNPCLYGGAFLLFFSSPNLRRLRHLELESFSFLRTAGQAAEALMSNEHCERFKL